MSNHLPLLFNEPDLFAKLGELGESELDALDFGVIGFDDQTVVSVYNTFESKAAGLTPQRALGQPFFTSVAPCMNNFLVAQRFEDAYTEGSILDVTIDYVLTLRMRPVKVVLRLLATPGVVTRYVLVKRPS